MGMRLPWEITDIVENLFIGNQLEQGKLRLCPCCFVDLKRIRNPLLIFASSGDNITPPYEALGWVPVVYPTTEALKAAGQRIVYLLNPHVGHLGIFVSASVARLEHRAILESVEELQTIEPGLYEMKIINPTGDPDCHKPQYQVAFEERRVEDLTYGVYSKTFEKVRGLSEFNTSLYEALAGPFVRALATPWTATWLKWAHPMRMSCYVYSERLNPWMVGIAVLAGLARQHRQRVDEDNPLLALERQVSQAISQGLETYRELRDAFSGQLFKLLFYE